MATHAEVQWPEKWNVFRNKNEHVIVQRLQTAPVKLQKEALGKINSLEKTLRKLKAKDEPV